MRYVISYDISDDRRRTRIAHLLEGHGDRVHFSVFEADLDRHTLTSVVDTLHELVIGPIDSVRIYRLCEGCRHASHTIGTAGLRDAPIAWIA